MSKKKLTTATIKKCFKLLNIDKQKQRDFFSQFFEKEKASSTENERTFIKITSETAESEESKNAELE